MKKFRSKWYRPPSLANLAKGWRSTASKTSSSQWESMKANPAKYGIHFPYREFRIKEEFPQIDLEGVRA